MKSPRPRSEIPTLMMGCIIGEEDLRTRTKRKELGLSWNGSISPTIRGQMKKVEYSLLFQGGLGGVSRSSAVLLTSRGSSSTRSRGSHLSPRRGSGLAMLLKSRGMREGPTGPH
jgi:hypothetical protein